MDFVVMVVVEAMVLEAMVPAETVLAVEADSVLEREVVVKEMAMVAVE